MYSFKNIHRAYKDCVKHKRNTLNALNFEANLVENICNLEDELKNKTYRIGKSIYFLASSPKLREIFAADFRDRVVHHVLVKELETFYEKKFIHDVYNNRKGKGIHGALKRAKSFMNSVGSDGCYLQLDIKGFFYNLDKNILFKYIHSQVKLVNESKIRHFELDSESILYLTNKIIYHDQQKTILLKVIEKKLENLPEHKTLFKLPKNQGLPIGNLTSQFFCKCLLK